MLGRGNCRFVDRDTSANVRKKTKPHKRGHQSRSSIIFLDFVGQSSQTKQRQELAQKVNWFITRPLTVVLGGYKRN